MGGIFGKEKKQAPPGAPAGKKPAPKKEVTDQERATLDLKNQRDKLHKYRMQLEGNIEREKELARQALAAGNKNKALLLLKKKRYQEGLLTQAEAQYANLDELVNSVEFAAMQKEVFARLKQGKDVLEALNKEMPIEDVERLMEDNAEAIAYQNQISEALSGQLTAQDEADVLAELEALTGTQETAAEAVPEQVEQVEQVEQAEQVAKVEEQAQQAEDDAAALDALEALENAPDVPDVPLPAVEETQQDKPQLVAA
eukprot:comp22962_c0_seq1/m.36459 comp22962_c0_seq1/g.36459  ORF comp22962_c0_seq1/g.36459 comp22962_c0_seq1/m.36459 type:complete len:256 (-) comp22962_c0_seq1:410-1177(-)